MSSAPIEVTYHVDRRDYLALSAALNPITLRTSLRLVAIWIVVFCLTIFASENFSLSGWLATMGSFVRFEAPWALYVVTVAVLLAVSFGAPQLNRLRARAAYRGLAIADADVRIGFSADGIESQSRGLSSHLDWTAIRRVIETPTHLFLAISRREALIVPRRGFADPADVDRVRVLIAASRVLPAA